MSIPLHEIVYRLRYNPFVKSLRVIPDFLRLTNRSKYLAFERSYRLSHAQVYELIDTILTKFHGGGGLRPPLQSYKLAELASLLQEYSPSDIVELGSGSSTGILAYYSSVSGAKVTSVEENPHWVDNTASVVNTLGFDHQVRIINKKALVSDDYKTAEYLDLGIAHCDLLIIDGPALKRDGVTRRTAVCLNARDIDARVILIDMRQPTALFLETLLSGRYDYFPSDILFRNQFSDSLRYWSVFVRK